ncbi:ARM repeat-containing [Mycena venus]|uniref:ARM repeat-containing n=1 Tax=Mycena venus TaxID=2733690 RepID=A0A8H7DE26_9AGAR|nr:ARM repeat-containing [Mycena venus]
MYIHDRSSIWSNLQPKTSTDEWALRIEQLRHAGASATFSRQLTESPGHVPSVRNDAKIMTKSYLNSTDSSLDSAPLTPLRSGYGLGRIQHHAQPVLSAEGSHSPTHDSRSPDEQHSPAANGPRFYKQRAYAYDPQNQQDQEQHWAGSVIVNMPIKYKSSCFSGVWPYAALVARIIETGDSHANAVLQNRIRVVGPVERRQIVDVICARGMQMMTHRLGNWPFQRLLETSTDSEERIALIRPFRGRVFDLATNRYGCYVLQTALDWKEEKTLVDAHASHVWIKVMQASRTLPAPARLYLNHLFFEFFEHKWATLACNLRGSLIVQFAFNNLEKNNKDRIVAELLGHGAEVFVAVTETRGGLVRHSAYPQATLEQAPPDGTSAPSRFYHLVELLDHCGSHTVAPDVPYPSHLIFNY